jgi:hypothetical protein
MPGRGGAPLSYTTPVDPMQVARCCVFFVKIRWFDLTMPGESNAKASTGLHRTKSRFCRSEF